MRLKSVLSKVMAAVMVLSAIPAIGASADSGFTVTTNAGSGVMVAYYGQYAYTDYNYTTDTVNDIKSMVEDTYISGDTVGHIGHYAWREGYGFAGWAEKENGTPLDLTSYKVTKNTNLYPVWSNDFSNVTVEGDCCRYMRGTFAIANGSSLKSFGLREAYNKKPGYSFKGFSTKKGSTKVIDLDTYKVTKDVTLYPVYSGIGKTVKDDAGNRYKVKGFDGPYYINVEFTAPKSRNIKQTVVDSYFYDSDYNYFTVTGVAKQAFKDCKKLTKLVLASPNSIGAEAFSGCDKLKSIAITSYYMDKKSVKNCFKGSSIKEIHCYKDCGENIKSCFTKKNTGSSVKVKVYDDFLGY